MKVILRQLLTFTSRASLLSCDVKAFALFPAQSWQETVFTGDKRSPQS